MHRNDYNFLSNYGDISFSLSCNCSHNILYTVRKDTRFVVVAVNKNGREGEKNRARAPVVDVFLFVCVRLYEFAQVQHNSNACCFDTNLCAGFTWTVLEFG